MVDSRVYLAAGSDFGKRLERVGQAIVRVHVHRVKNCPRLWPKDAVGGEEGEVAEVGGASMAVFHRDAFPEWRVMG